MIICHLSLSEMAVTFSTCLNASLVSLSLFRSVLLTAIKTSVCSHLEVYECVHSRESSMGLQGSSLWPIISLTPKPSLYKDYVRGEKIWGWTQGKGCSDFQFRVHSHPYTTTRIFIGSRGRDLVWSSLLSWVLSPSFLYTHKLHRFLSKKDHPSLKRWCVSIKRLRLNMGAVTRDVFGFMASRYSSLN